jgi:hypothetical protein
MSMIRVSQCLTMISMVVLLGVNGFSSTLIIQATDDIYAAGHSTLPATLFPGTFPSSVDFAATPNQFLTFSNVTGTVGCNFVVTNGPDGTCFPGVNTTVTSYGGLSGISVSQANMFLVGVFLDAGEPMGSGPSVLSYDFGTVNSLNTTNSSFSPELDQVFFIGDGLTGTGSGQEQVFRTPSGAVRFYLGFADSFDHLPSFYADDVGSLTATFEFTTGAAAAPEPASILLVASTLAVGVLRYRKKARLSLNARPQDGNSATSVSSERNQRRSRIG